MTIEQGRTRKSSPSNELENGYRPSFKWDSYETSLAVAAARSTRQADSHSGHTQQPSFSIAAERRSYPQEGHISARTRMRTLRCERSLACKTKGPRNAKGSTDITRTNLSQGESGIRPVRTAPVAKRTANNNVCSAIQFIWAGVRGSNAADLRSRMSSSIDLPLPKTDSSWQGRPRSSLTVGRRIYMEHFGLYSLGE